MWALMEGPTRRKVTTFCCRMAGHPQLPAAPLLFISSMQPRHRVDANAKKERLNGILAYSYLPLAQRVQPPMIASCQERTRMLALGCVLRLGQFLIFAVNNHADPLALIL